MHLLPWTSKFQNSLFHVLQIRERKVLGPMMMTIIIIIIIIIIITINERINVAFSPKTARTRNTHKKRRHVR